MLAYSTVQFYLNYLNRLQRGFSCSTSQIIRNAECDVAGLSAVEQLLFSRINMRPSPTCLCIHTKCIVLSASCCEKRRSSAMPILEFPFLSLTYIRMFIFMFCTCIYLSLILCRHIIIYVSLLFTLSVLFQFVLLQLFFIDFMFRFFKIIFIRFVNMVFCVYTYRQLIIEGCHKTL